MKPEHQERDKIEERRPQHRVMRPQHPGRYDGRDRIGGVVQSVQEIRTAARLRLIRPVSEDQVWRPLRGPALYLFYDDTVDLIGNIVEAVGHFLEMVVNLRADDEIHRVGVAVLEE